MRFVVSLFLALSLVACGSGESDTSVVADTQDARSGGFPIHPDERMTPGALCDPRDADQHRYPEQIPYCSRNVDSATKRDIISQYDSDLGFRVGRMNRGDFKIDHFIPLCMGGANSRKNLWPQHKSVYEKTDIIEQRLCEMMAAGLMRQTEAVAQIRHVKFHLEDAAALATRLDGQLRR